MGEIDGLRARRRAQTERDIEDAALASFGTAGFEGTTMEQIAASAGVSVRTAFRYFPSKVDTVLFSARQVSSVIGRELWPLVESGATLTELEDAIARSLSSLVEADAEIVARLKQLRSLMLGDDRLRGDVLKSEGYSAGMGEPNIANSGMSLESRLRVELTSATLRAAFDTWAASPDGDDLVTHYRRAREAREKLLR